VLASFVALQLCAATFVIQNVDTGSSGEFRCLTALGSAADPISLVMTTPCDNTTQSQHWTYDSTGTGKICSVLAGTGCLRHSDGDSFLGYSDPNDVKGRNPVVALARSGAPLNNWPEHAFDYNPSSKAIYPKGSCSSVLDAAGFAYPTYIHANPSDCNPACDCNAPEPEQQWTFISV
jgi:hypothetical protein